MPAQSVVPSFDAPGACDVPSPEGDHVLGLGHVVAAHVAFVAGVALLAQGRMVVAVVVGGGTSR